MISTRKHETQVVAAATGSINFGWDSFSRVIVFHGEKK